MAWFDAIKGALYETGEPTAAPPQAQPAPVVGQTVPVSSAPVGINAEMVSAIKKATLGRNTAYTQLLQASDGLSDIIPDQVMRLKAAHKTAGGGRTGKQIAEAVDIHLQDIDGEELRFKAAVDATIGSEIATLEAQANTAASQAQQAQAEIVQVQERIAALSKLIVDLGVKAAESSAAVAQKRIDLDTAVSQFKMAAQSVRVELNSSKTAILSTLV